MSGKRQNEEQSLSGVKVGDWLVLETPAGVAGYPSIIKPAMVTHRTARRIRVKQHTCDFNLSGTLTYRGGGSTLRLGKPGEVEQLRSEWERRAAEELAMNKKREARRKQDDWQAANFLDGIFSTCVNADALLHQFDAASVIKAAKALGWKKQD